jgi:hypothetical protein
LVTFVSQSEEAIWSARQGDSSGILPQLENSTGPI